MKVSCNRIWVYFMSYHKCFSFNISIY